MTYASVASLRSHLAISGEVNDLALSAALAAASRAVDEWCGRTFETPTAVSSMTQRACDPVTFRLRSGWDIHTATGLVVETDDNDDGTFETLWTISTDFVFGSPDVRSVVGWPTTTLIAVGDRTWPVGGVRERVRVTARFGWAAVPDPVEAATLLVAAQLWKMRDAPLGVAGFGEFGAVRVRGLPPMVEMLLASFRAGETVAGLA